MSKTKVENTPRKRGMGRYGLAVALLVVIGVVANAENGSDAGSGSADVGSGTEPRSEPPVGTAPVNSASESEPFSLELEIVDGIKQNVAHAELPAGSSLVLGAKIHDANGNVIQSTPEHPCTVRFKLDGATGDGGVRASIDGDTLNFGPAKGAFIVSAACAENPGINSFGDDAATPNFETTDASEAKKEHVVTDKHDNTFSRTNILIGVGLAVLVAGVVVLAVATSHGSTGVDCKCRCDYVTDCTNGGSSVCKAIDPNSVCRCPAAGNGCDGAGHTTSTANVANVGRPSSVEELVSSGIQHTRVAAAPAPIGTGKRTPPPPGWSTSRRWIGAAVSTVALAATLTSMLLSQHSSSIEVTPWFNVDGGGIGVTARF